MTVRGSSDCPVDQPSPPLSLQKGEATQEARNRSKLARKQARYRNAPPFCKLKLKNCLKKACIWSSVIVNYITI